MKILAFALVIIAILGIPNVIVDQSDRSLLVDKAKCNRSDIDRIIFQFTSKDARVYKIKGETWLVHGVFWKVASKVE